MSNENDKLAILISLVVPVSIIIVSVILAISPKIVDYSHFRKQQRFNIKSNNFVSTVYVVYV